MTIFKWFSTGLLALPLWQVAAAGLVTTHLTIIAVTVYLHRNQTHHALTLHPLPAHCFRFWLWLTTGMVTREWVAVHRSHHAHCESELDPHSPRTKGIGTVLLRGAELYRAAAADPVLVHRYGTGAPDDWIERRLYSRYTWQGVAVLLIAYVAAFGVIGLTLWAIHMLWIPVLAAGVVNGLGHYTGYRNFDGPDASANLMPLGLLIGGEELHNNHHALPTSAKFSVRWFEFDAGWVYVRLLVWLRLASVRPLAAPLTLRAEPCVPTIGTLHQVLCNRAILTRQLSACAVAALRIQRNTLRQALSAPALARIEALLARTPGRLGHDEEAELACFCAMHPGFEQIQELRRGFEALWHRSAAPPAELLLQLSAWCAAAGHVRPLGRFANHLIRYG